MSVLVTFHTMPIYLSTYQSVYLFICLATYLIIHQSVYLLICLSIHSSIYLAIYIYRFLSSESTKKPQKQKSNQSFKDEIIGFMPNLKLNKALHLTHNLPQRLITKKPACLFLLPFSLFICNKMVPFDLHICLSLLLY